MSVWKNRNFVILFSGRLVSTVGDNLYDIALPWYIYTATGSRTDLALAGFFQHLPVVAGLFVGVWVDRWRKRRTMIASDLLRAGLSICMYVVALSHIPLLPLLIALVAGLRLVGTVFSPASAVMITQIVPKEDIPAVSGTQQLGNGFAGLVGAIGGGTLIAWLGPAVLFLVNGLSFLVSVLSLCFVKADDPHPGQVKARSFRREWSEGFGVMIRSRFVMLLVTVAALTNFAFAPFDVFMTLWVKTRLHGNAVELGLINGALLTGMIAGGICLGPVSKRIDIKNLLRFGLIGMGVCMSLLGLYASLPWAMAVMFIVGFLSGTINGSIGAMAVQTIPRNLIGRVMAPMQSLTNVAMPAGMAVCGALLVYLQLPVLFALVGSIAVLSGLSFFLPVRNDFTAVSDVTSADSV